MTILITGACSGIGVEVGKRLSLYGHKVILGIHTKSQLKRSEARLKEYSNIKCIKLDVVKRSELIELLDIKLDVLICNAAIGYSGSILETPIKLIKENYEVNVFSTINIIQLVFKQMLKRNTGRIIIMSSLLGEVPMKFFGSYASTKASLISLAITMKKEIKILSKNIKVSLIMPGAYHTGFNQYIIENKFSWMSEESYFKNLEKLREKELKLFSVIEKKSLSSIVRKIEDAVLSSKPKFVYRAPFLQSLITRCVSFIYRLKLF